MSTHSSVAPIRWHRVGALSTSLSLHGLALALAVLVLTRPALLPEPAVVEPDDRLIVDVVEPEPIPAPDPPTVELAPTPAEVLPIVQPKVAPTPNVQPITTSSISDSPVAIVVPDVNTRDGSGSDHTAPLTRGAVAYDDMRLPDYPAMAKRQGLQGETLLRVLVGSDGRVEQIRIARSSGHAQLDRAALAAVRDWRFHPATDAGSAIAAWVVVPIVFRLDQH